MEKIKLATLTRMSTERLENTSNYHCVNLVNLQKILEGYFDRTCDLNRDESARLNAHTLISNTDKIRALVYTMGDIITEIAECLDFVVEDIYAPEEIKEELERVFGEMVAEREEMENFFDELNARIAEENKSRMQTVSAD